MQRATGVAVMSFTRVTSLLTLISWQLVHPMAIAEWTDLPFVLSSWHCAQVAGSCLGSKGTGCLAAQAAVQDALIRTMIEIAFRTLFTTASAIPVCNCVAVVNTVMRIVAAGFLNY
jgi:hypothetical protein